MTTSRVTKAAVITCSCLLAGGYLIYASSDAMNTSSKRAHVTMDSTVPPAEEFTMPSGDTFVDVFPTTQPRSIIPSAWKSAPVTVLPQASEDRTMIGGSKSNQATIMPTTQPRRMIYGSKSGRVFDSENTDILFADPVEFMAVPTTSPATQPSTAPATQPATAPTTRSERRMFPGSKSMPLTPQQQR